MILGRAQRARLQRIARGRSDEPLHVLEGVKAVRDALERGLVEELWLRHDLDSRVGEDLADRARASGVAVGRGAAADFDRLGGVVTSPGVLALVRDVEAPLEKVVGVAGRLLWLDGVQDPGNVGALVRVAVAFGFAGLLAGEGTADPLGLKALRASAGLALALPFSRAPGLLLRAAVAAGGRPVWALERGGEDLFGTPPAPLGLVLVVGAEGPGLGAEARAAASRRIGIPLAPGVDSLNAAVAAGIAAAWITRRRAP